LLAILFAKPFIAADLQAFEDPENVGNSFAYFALLIAFTALILWIAKKGKKWMIQAIILTAVGSTVMYVVAPLLLTFPSVGVMTAWGLGALLGGGSVYWLYVRPEWYVVDFVGILVAAGAAAIFGISLGIVPVVVLLVALAIYDAIAVYKTKHMLSLADSVIELRLPVLLVIPKHRGYSFLREAAKFKEANPENKESREAFFMGLGDLVMPTILVVSALTFGSGIEPVLGAAVGMLVGFAVLMAFVLKGNPQAGLPLLNGGAILGFMTGVYASTGSIVFW
jgi:presenilin-like A22 family membrane protease